MIDNEGYSEPVQCYCPIERGYSYDGPITIGTYSRYSGWTDYETFALGVTHWKLLPDAPEDSE